MNIAAIFFLACICTVWGAPITTITTTSTWTSAETSTETLAATGKIATVVIYAPVPTTTITLHWPKSTTSTRIISGTPGGTAFEVDFVPKETATTTNT